MLKFMIPLIITMLMKQMNKSWWLMASTYLLMTFTSLILVPHSSTNTMLTTFSSVDLMSYSLFILSLLMATLMLIASTKIYYLKNNFMLFSNMNGILLITLLMSFTMSSIILFYIWFEASLIPTMIIIMTWGYQPERLQASMYLMIYTIMASLPMFLMFCIIYNMSMHMNMPMLMEFKYPNFMTMSKIFWFLLVGGFLVKLPMFVFHLWLPKAHVEAPIAGSMVLAAILLKLGGYGLLRMSTLFPPLNSSLAPTLMSLSVLGAIYTSILCLRQPDLKSLIAYSSVGHMGIMLAGMLSNTYWGMLGSLMMMIAHGLCSSGLFAMANMSYESTSTRSMFLTKGIMSINPIMTLWWFLLIAANMAAPPTINLMSEIMLITSCISKSMWLAMFVGMISFLTAAYSLHMYSATQHGQFMSFSNPLKTMKSKDYLLLMIHLIPIWLIIIKPELISEWI